MIRYAIGDVHGQRALLEAMLVALAADQGVSNTGPGRPTVLLVGDYVDRGPASAQVIEMLMVGCHGPFQLHCLKGNHEEMMLAARTDPKAATLWLVNGGLATLRSYGWTPPPGVSVGFLPGEVVMEAALACVPEAHWRWIEALPTLHQDERYVYAHAGLHPDRPLSRQTARDLLWIREPFLSRAGKLGHTVVHGHTPAFAPEVFPFRIGIDTGTGYGGPLTALATTGKKPRFIQIGGHR